VTEASAPLIAGPRAGLLGDVAALHGRYYAAAYGFPVFFEAKVAREMGEYLLRYDPTRDLTLSVDHANRIAGAITLDGSDPEGTPDQAHLRWLILDDALRGQGYGRRLVQAVVDLAREKDFRSIYLTTFRELAPAGGVYQAFGFRVTNEQPGETWGRIVTEQRLELVL